MVPAGALESWTGPAGALESWTGPAGALESWTGPAGALESWTELALEDAGEEPALGGRSGSAASRGALEAQRLGGALAAQTLGGTLAPRSWTGPAGTTESWMGPAEIPHERRTRTSRRRRRCSISAKADLFVWSSLLSRCTRGEPGTRNEETRNFF